MSCLSLLPRVLKGSLSLCKDELQHFCCSILGWPAGSDDSGGKGGCVCVENLIILLKIVEGWALTRSLESPAARGVRHCSVLLCTSAECGAFGGQGGPGCRGWTEAFPSRSSTPISCSTCLLWLALSCTSTESPTCRSSASRSEGAAQRRMGCSRSSLQPKITTKREPPARAKHPGLAKGIPKKNPSFSWWGVELHGDSD